MTLTTVAHGTLGIIDGQRVHFGTIEGYAAEYREDAVEAIARAIKNGHELVWAGLEATVLYGDKSAYAADRAKWANAVVLSIGDSVIIGDGIYRIERAPNRNFKLARVKRVDGCQ